MISNKELLAKAALESTDFGGVGEARLTVEQAEAFVRIASTPQAMLSDVRTVLNNANSWEENKLSFGRILHAASEAGVGETGRVDVDKQTKPGTGIVTINTELFRGEVLISDGVMEDNVEREGFAGSVTAMIAERCGVDVEDLFINGNIGGGDAFYGVLDGWLSQIRNGVTPHDASGDADFQATLKVLLSSIPSAFKVDKTNMRFYCSDVIEEAYRDLLSTRGTPLGDRALEGTDQLRYQGIAIKPVPLFPIDVGFSPVVLTHRLNLYAGWRRQITLEPYRDPRDGGTTFIVTTRVDAKVGHLPAAAIADNVPTGDLGS